MAYALGVLAAQLIRDILVQGASKIGVQHLDAAADAKDGLFPVHKGFDELPFQIIP